MWQPAIWVNTWVPGWFIFHPFPKLSKINCRNVIGLHGILLHLLLVLTCIHAGDAQDIDNPTLVNRFEPLHRDQRKAVIDAILIPADGSLFSVVSTSCDTYVTCTLSSVNEQKPCFVEVGDEQKSRCEEVHLVRNASALYLAVEESDMTSQCRTFCIFQQVPEHYVLYTSVVYKLTEAPTCPALSMPTFVMKSGCNEDPSGQVKPGSTCHFSCPDGYIGRGDVNRTCLADGTWSNTKFTCEAVTCPSDNVTKPYLEGCDPDSAGGIATGTICSFPCDGCIDDVRMVCLRNGTWLDISTNSQGDQPDFYKWAFVTTAIVFSVFCMILIYWCWNRKNEQGEHRSIFRAVYRKLRGDRAAGIDT